MGIDREKNTSKTIPPTRAGKKSEGGAGMSKKKV